ncbi:isochorismatase hydrolase [Apiospora rasikravindrae]|uniref:Isochorismatase hydrolase n=1 Tax=Apiospora rasikravindrae TaxID=990691 RepID=A0ABR1S2W8_9PEZI
MKPASSAKTALILIDVQNGFLHPSYWGTERSTPECESNIAKLLTQARTHNAKNNTASGDHDDGSSDDEGAVLICHVHHHSITPSSMLHPDKTIEIDGIPRRAVDAQPFAAPLAGETVWTKDVNSAFIGTGLEAFLRARRVRQLVLCGLTTDHCVSTSTRMAGNLRIVDEVEDEKDQSEKTAVRKSEGDVMLVGDACATYAKGGFGAETVHRVSLASLDGEFAHVAETAAVLGTVFGV